MIDIDKIVKAAITSVLTATAAATLLNTNADAATAQKMEKCYGITKAGMNDCQTLTQSCAGSATVDNQLDAFIFLPKGLCDRIVGGSTTSKK